MVGRKNTHIHIYKNSTWIRLALDLRLPRKFKQVRKRVLTALPPSRTTSLGKLMRTFLSFMPACLWQYISDAAAPIHSFRKDYRVKIWSVNKADYQFYTVSFFPPFFAHPNKLLFAKRLTLKSNCQSSHKFNSQLSILVMLWWESCFCGNNLSSLFPFVSWICIQNP